MEYYHDLITQKSWEELQTLRKTVDFVLIGGWAVYLYTKALKSKDIDILVDFNQLPVLQKNYQLSKNDRLRKYEASKEDIQIDIYLPHYSKIGIPIEVLMQKSDHLEGFNILEIDYLMGLKLFTLQQRGRSVKGRKDFIDIISLVKSGLLKWGIVKKIIETYALQDSISSFNDFLNESYDIPELNLNTHQFSKIKKEVRAALGAKNPDIS